MLTVSNSKTGPNPRVVKNSKPAPEYENLVVRVLDLLNMAAKTGHLGTGSGFTIAPAQSFAPGPCKDV